MREIKFRAYSKTYNKVLDIISINMDLKTVLLESENKLGRYSLELEDVDLMQYTGLKDRNGVEIYEGDIIKATYGTELNSDFTESAVFMEYYSWSLCRNEMVYETFDDLISDGCIIEVIGNIYEKKDLLCSMQ